VEVGARRSVYPWRMSDLAPRGPRMPRSQREQRAFHPHLTLARASARASGDPHQQRRAGGSPFRNLAEHLPATPPHFGTMTAHEFFLYQSKLGPKGAQYTKIACFPLA